MWQSRPIFISSTFTDMQAERDYLRSRVFPELEERLRGRRHNLEWVDLRVGVATASEDDEHVRELHVLKVCLDEVRRCRPFLIVLLGDRYGWVPPKERIKAAAEEAREGFFADVAGRSVTDLEIEFGVLSDPEQQPRTFFYFREPLPYADMPAEIAALYCEDYAIDPAKAERKTRLAALKRRIETRLPGRMVPYRVAWDNARQRVTGLEDFGRMVLEDIWSELDAETQTLAAAADIPWQESEREALEDFIDDRARDFVGRRSILDSLIALATASDTDGAMLGACVTADPGSGKSALFGELYRCLRGGQVFLLAHAAGASVNAASVDSMLRRFIGELAGALGTDPELPENADPDSVESTFTRLLGQMAQRRRVVILVDALDQFERTTRSRYLTWLPRLLPANARFIATAIAGEASKALAERQWFQCFALPPIDAVEARDIVAGICRRYHRTFEPEVIEALLEKRGPDGPAWGNPLWLVLAVEDLNLLDADDFARAHRDYAGSPGERLRELMLDTVASFPIDISGLYAHTFERAEELFGEGLARAYLGLIAVSRAGWRESDFRMLLPRASGEQWDELKFAQLRRFFRGQLRRRGALVQWDFSHAQMRASVRAKFGPWSIEEKNLNTIIADRLLSCPPDDPLHISETMVHLLAAQDHDRAARYYGDISLSVLEKQGATRVLADYIIAPTTGTPAMAARDISRLLKTTDPLFCAHAASLFLFNLGDALEHMAPLDSRLVIMDSAKKAFERLLRSNPNSSRNAIWQDDLSISYIKIGRLLVAQGNLAEALKIYCDALAIRNQLARTDTGNARWQRDLSSALWYVADIEMQQGNLTSALERLSAGQAILERLARTEPGSASLQRNLSVSYDKLGDVQLAQGNLPETLKFYRDALVIIDRLARADPGNAELQRELSVAYDKVGDVQVRLGNRSEALKCYQDAFAIRERLVSTDPGNATWQSDLSSSYDRLGNMQVAQGNLAEALKYCQDSLAIRDQLTRSDPGNAYWQRDLSKSYIKIGDVQVDQGNLPEALKSYQDSFAIIDRLARADPGNAAWQGDLSTSYDRLGNVLVAQGNLPEALKFYRDSLAIRVQLARTDLGNAGWWRDLLQSYENVGGLLVAQGDLPEALKSYSEALAIADRFARADPGNAAGWQRALFSALWNVADVEMQQGNVNAALERLSAGKAIMERLVAADPSNAAWQTDLAGAYSRIGDVLKAQGNLPEALTMYRDSLAICTQLARSDPDNASWQRDLAVSQAKLATVFMKFGEITKALDVLRQGRAILARIIELSPSNAVWKDNLAWFDGEIARLSESSFGALPGS